MIAEGTFEVKISFEPPYSEIESVTLARARAEKAFQGSLRATSHVDMIGARTAAPDSAGYVAMERVEGTLEGRTGTFVLQHSSSMSGGEQSQSISVVPGSGTGELAGLSGTMVIRIADGQHHYRFEYEVGDAS
jgi:hypothetical protein